jgi:hypothetical protein
MKRPSSRFIRYTSGALPTTNSSALYGAYAMSRPCASAMEGGKGENNARRHGWREHKVCAIEGQQAS